MTKLQIYNIALQQHGKKCTQAELDSANPPYEVQVCNTNYEAAWRKVLGECDWQSMLVKVDVADCDDEPAGKWAHGFVLPYGIMRVSSISSKPYQIRAGHFYTDEDNPDIYYMPEFFDCRIAPENICHLVGLALAFELCAILAPADNAISQRIVQSYGWLLQPMISAEAPSYIRGPEEGGPVNIGGLYGDFRP